MKKQKTIKILLWIATLFFILFTIRICFGVIQLRNTNIDTIGWAISTIALIGLNIAEWIAEDKNNPLNLKRQKAAISYCATKKYGTKKELIDKHGEEIYKHFLQTGIIHELFPTSDEDRAFSRWEYTVRGERIKKEIFS